MRPVIQFLTILPVPGATSQPLGRSAWAFPIVGAMLGLGAAFCIKAAGAPGPLLAIAFLALVTGGLHEDGLADVFDALRAGRTRERMLAILKDSRIGAHGTLALIVITAWRWQALAQISGSRVLLLAPAAIGISRGAMVLLAACSPSAGEGLGRAFAESISKWAAMVAAALSLALAAACGWPEAGWLVGANLGLLLVLRAWFRARIGGVTGDCLGAAGQLSEAVSLGLLAWL